MTSLKEMSTAAKALGVLSFILFILLIITIFPEKRQGGLAPIETVRHPSNHQIYSGYDFSADDNIVNVGYQPLYLPTSWIFEAVKRDTLLKNALSALGLDIRFHPFLKGDDVNFFMRRGDLDVGVGGDMSALTIAATDDVVIPAMIQQGFTSIVANRSMLVKDLRGKRIGYAYGSNAHFTVLDALASEGLTEADVDLVAMEITDMPEALQLGHIDAFSGWEPIPTITLATYPKCVVVHRSMSTGYLYFNTGFADRNREAVRHIVASEVRALQWLQQRKDNVITACDWTCQSNEKLSTSFPECPTDWRPLLAESDILSTKSPPFIPNSDLLDSGPLHREFEFLKALGKVPHSSRWEAVRKAFDHQILSEVMADAEKYDLDAPAFAVEEHRHER